MGSNDTHITSTSVTRRRHRHRTVAALASAAAIALGACGADRGDESADTTLDSVSEASERVVGIGGGEFEQDASVDVPETGGVASGGVPVALESRDIITSVGLSMSTSDVRQTAEDVRRAATTAGGIVFSSDVFLEDARSDGSVPGGGQIVVKVPPRDLDRLVADLDGVGAVTRLSQDAEDVTEQLVDLDIRIRQAEAGIARIELLLEEASALDDVFAIENELNERTVDLERLRAAERNTEGLVALATLTIQIEYRTPDALQEIVEHDGGIGDAFADGWDAFVGTVFAVGFVLAVTAPFLVTGLVVLALGWLIARMWNRRQAALHEARRQAADRRGDDRVDIASPDGPSSTPPAPVASQRVPDAPATEDADTITHDSD